MKNAYHLAQTQKKKDRGETSTRRERDDFWKNLWHMNVAPVVKFFLWKAANDILPTRSNFYSQKVTDSPHCKICMKDVGIVMHAI